MPKNTIYALSTSFTKSAIAIVRVSGDLALNSLKEISKKQDFIPNKATLTNLHKDGEVLDNAIVIYFKAPNSYSGEDLVEYHIHGSIAVIKDLLELLGSMDGHRMAEAGEFTKKALENNKLSLIEAEGIADLINAETYQQRKQAIREIQGEVGKKYQFWYDELKDIVALIEATIDFSDQDIPEDTFTIAYSKIDTIIELIKTEILSGNKVKKLRDGINVAIIGTPNVGKSSLINYLSKRDVAIVSNIAGTTRDVIDVFLDIGGFPINLSDTAGIRETEEEIEKEGIKRALKKAEEADIKLIVLDATKNDAKYSNMDDLLDENSFLIVNKIDLLENSQVYDFFNDKKVYFVSIKDKKGLIELEKDLIIKFSEISGVMENPIVLQQRHNDIIKNCLKELELSLENKDDIVIISLHLRNALNQIGKILGKVDIEEILGIIFSNFCIGK